VKILVFDTSSSQLAVGVVTDGGNLTARTDESFKHSEKLLPEIGACLKEAGISIEEIDLIGCAIGPGSFMGLRIGLSTAKGLSLAREIPWVGVPTLDYLARGLDISDRPIVPILDARKNRVYSAIFLDRKRVSDYLDISIRDLLAKLAEFDSLAFTGPDADLLTDAALERSRYIIDKGDAGLRLKSLAELAREKFALSGPAGDLEGPFYMREPEIG
jgi:tRNA threonylcarbamoyladenosine biosynthesis protein TsaB